MTTSESRGSETLMSLRLCSRAPETTRDSERDIRPPEILGVRTDVRSGRGGEDARVRELFPQVPQERIDLQVRAGDAPEQLARQELAAVAVDVLAQPLAQRREL